MIEVFIFLGAGLLFWSTTVVIDRWNPVIVPRVTVCEELANLRRKYRGCGQVGTTLPLEMVLSAFSLSHPMMGDELIGYRLYGCTIVRVRGLEVDFAYP